MAILPPKITLADFNRFYDKIDASEVIIRHGRLYRSFIDYLQQTVPFSTLHDDRKKWNGRQYKKSFPDKLKTGGDYKQWYTYNIDGRDEAQINFALSDDSFRIGIGFDFNEEYGGNPSQVNSLFRQFRKLLIMNKYLFDNIEELGLGVEYCNIDMIGSIKIPPKDTQNWLTDDNNLSDLEFLFFGRILYKKNDKDLDTLGNPEKFDAEIRSTFSMLWDIWKKTNLSILGVNNIT